MINLCSNGNSWRQKSRNNWNAARKLSMRFYFQIPSDPFLSSWQLFLFACNAIALSLCMVWLKDRAPCHSINIGLGKWAQCHRAALQEPTLLRCNRTRTTPRILRRQKWKTVLCMRHASLFVERFRAKSNAKLSVSRMVDLRMRTKHYYQSDLHVQVR